MSLATLAAADLSSVLALGDVGEDVEYEANRLTVVFGPVELADFGNGFVADSVRCWVPVTALTAPDVPLQPARGERVTRYPDDVAAEEWEIDHVAKGPVTWELSLLRSIRPVPRGA